MRRSDVSGAARDRSLTTWRTVLTAVVCLGLLAGSAFAFLPGLEHQRLLGSWLILLANAVLPFLIWVSHRITARHSGGDDQAR